MQLAPLTTCHHTMPQQIEVSPGPTKPRRTRSQSIDPGFTATSTRDLIRHQIPISPDVRLRRKRSTPKASCRVCIGTPILPNSTRVGSKNGFNHVGSNPTKPHSPPYIRIRTINGRQPSMTIQAPRLQFRETVVLAQSCAADQAHLRSHSRAGASDVLCGCPTAPDHTAGVQDDCVREVAVESVADHCECGAALDRCGRHRAACPRSGRLYRATAPKRTLAWVCREAGAMERTHAELGDLDTIDTVFDDRSIDILASGLPFHHGAQLAVDIILRSAHNIRGGVPSCFQSQRRRSGQGSARQRTEIPRALGWRSVSFTRRGTGDRRQME